MTTRIRCVNSSDRCYDCKAAPSIPVFIFDIPHCPYGGPRMVLYHLLILHKACVSVSQECRWPRDFGVVTGALRQ